MGKEHEMTPRNKQMSLLERACLQRPTQIKLQTNKYWYYWAKTGKQILVLVGKNSLDKN
jgi:hypothetical protein